MTKTRLALLPVCVTALFTLACIGGKDVEGDEAGECNDGVDNDLNDVFDCDEEACVGSPLCEDPTGGDDTGGGGGDDTGGGGPTDEVTLLSAVADCDSVGYFFDVNQTGSGDAPELYIYETGSSNPWNEVHPFPSEPFDSAPNGSWVLYYMELDSVDSISAVREGETTLFDCNMMDNLTFLVVVYDANGVGTDCGAWGEDVQKANKYWGTSCPAI